MMIRASKILPVRTRIYLLEDFWKEEVRLNAHLLVTFIARKERINPKHQVFMIEEYSN
jgi:hypothetical protein